MASHHQAATDPPRPPLPGDIVQVIDKADRFYLALLIVQTARTWGVQAEMPAFDADGKPAVIYARLREGSYQVVGTAALVSGELAQARRDAEETARLVAKEAGQ
jgi:hypothetical protein